MISVNLKPFAKPRPRVTRSGKHTYNDPNYTKAKIDLQRLYANAGGELDVEGAISMSVHFVFAMPKSWSKKRKLEMDGAWCLKTPDLDNCIGGVMDALLSNDSKVAQLVDCVKVWGYEDAIRIDIQTEMLAKHIPF